MTVDTIPHSSIPTDQGQNGHKIESVLKKFAAVTLLPLTVMTVPAQADPGDGAYSGANYNVFLQAIADDGIVIDPHEAIAEGLAVCKAMSQPDGASLWDAGQQLHSMHSDWDMGKSLHFADRSVQDICPNRGSF